MTNAFRPILLVGAAVLALLLVLAGAYAESTFLVLLGIAGVPLILLGVVALHYVNSVQRNSELTTMQRSYVEGAALRVERELNATLTAAVAARLPESEIERFFGEVQAALAPEAEIHREEGRVQVVLGDKGAQGGWARRAERALATASQSAATRVAPALEARVREFGGAGALPRSSLAQTCEAYAGNFTGASAVVAERMTLAERAISDVEAELDVEEAWEHIRSAKKLWKGGETELALRALADAEKIVHEHLRPAFDARRDGLLAHMDELMKAEVASVASAQTMDALRRSRQEVAKRDLKGVGLAGIEADERRFAQLLQTIAAEARAKVTHLRGVLVDYPSLVDIESLDDLARQLETTPIIEHPYQEQFPMWMDSMRSALLRMSRYGSATKVVGVMSKMELIVERKLKENGTVRATDLPVREHGDMILEIYAKRHPEVRLEKGVLTAARRPIDVQVERAPRTEETELG